jgi:hypothetical protein
VPLNLCEVLERLIRRENPLGSDRGIDSDHASRSSARPLIACLVE